MGRRGPNPQPTRLKVLAGNPGKRPLKKQPKPASAKVDCPEWLSKDAKAEWRRLAPELERRGLLTPLDRAAFTAYCNSYSRWRECLDAIETLGPMYVTASGRIVERPEVHMAKEYSQSMRAFAVEFGMTPNSRSRMSLEGAIEDDSCERCGMPADMCGCG